MAPRRAGRLPKVLPLPPAARKSHPALFFPTITRASSRVDRNIHRIEPFVSIRCRCNNAIAVCVVGNNARTYARLCSMRIHRGRNIRHKIAKWKNCLTGRVILLKALFKPGVSALLVPSISIDFHRVLHARLPSYALDGVFSFLEQFISIHVFNCSNAAVVKSETSHTLYLLPYPVHNNNGVDISLQYCPFRISLDRWRPDRGDRRQRISKL